MNSMYFRIFLSLFLTYLLIGLSGCMSIKLNSVDGLNLYIERIKSNRLTFRNVRVIQSGDGVVVAGNIKRRKNSVGTSGGHIDMALLNNEGEVIQKVSTFYTPRRFSRRSLFTPSFKVRFSGMPIEASVVRVAYHNSKKIENSIDLSFDCGNNRALSCKGC